MTKLKLQTEVKVGDVWRAVSLDEAATHYVMATKRCPACHGQVMIPGTYGSPSIRRTCHTGGRIAAVRSSPTHTPARRGRIRRRSFKTAAWPAARSDYMLAGNDRWLESP